MNKYSLIIFDLDNTLFDYRASEIYAIKHACLKNDIAFTDDLYSVYKNANNIAKGKVSDYILNLNEFRRVRATIFLDSIDHRDVIVDQFIKDYLTASEDGILIKDVENTLSSLKGIKNVVGTNGSTYPRKNKLEKSTIAQYFSGFYSSEQLGVAKPNPLFFLSICEAQAVSPKNTLVVGDSYKDDVMGALSAGIDACLISNKTITVPNVYVISTISGLLEVINE